MFYASAARFNVMENIVKFWVFRCMTHIYLINVVVPYTA